MQRYKIDDETTGWKVLGRTDRSQAAVMRIDPGGKVGGPSNEHDADQWLFVLSGRTMRTQRRPSSSGSGQSSIF